MTGAITNAILVADLLDVVERLRLTMRTNTYPQ
jgi:hypothetical protein